MHARPRPRQKAAGTRAHPQACARRYAEGPLVDRAIAQGGADAEKVNANRAANVPRGEQILPTEVANVAAFLSSDVSSAINATEVFADGGNHACTYGP